MCTFLIQNGALWAILADALWDLWDGSIEDRVREDVTRNLRVPDIEVSDRDFTGMIGCEGSSHSNGRQAACPIVTFTCQQAVSDGSNFIRETFAVGEIHLAFSLWDGAAVGLGWGDQLLSGEKHGQLKNKVGWNGERRQGEIDGASSLVSWHSQVSATLVKFRHP